MPDHIHAFVGLRPIMALADLARDIKNNSANFINSQKFIKTKFSWQEGYGAFSYSRSHVKAITDYVMNQEEHHRNKTFLEEYRQFLEKFEVEFDERYIFKLPE